MRIAIIFLTLTIFTFILYGLGWQEIEIGKLLIIFLGIGIGVGCCLAFLQDIKEIKRD